MFAKLLKHELLSSRRVLFALDLTVLGAGVLGAVILRILFSQEATQAASAADDRTAVLLPIVLVFLFLGIMVSVIGSEIYLLFRFYKSKFTDEGYLTFTLPVSSRQIFLASFANIAIWTLIISVVMFLSIGIMIVGGLSGADIDLGEGFRSMGDAFAQLQLDEPKYIILSILNAVFSYAASIVVAMTCITVGSVLAKKHKILAAIGIYYGYSLVYSILSAILTVSSAIDSDMDSLMLLQLVVPLAATVGGFFLSTYLMQKKLNLP